MAARGTAKRYSIEQEDYVARIYDGRRSRTSGAAEHDAGDVLCEALLIECKVRMPAQVTKPLPKFIQQLEKIAEEAFESGKDPMLALRYYAPNSILADRDGWVDVSVRRMCDDADREATYINAKAQPHQDEQAGQEQTGS
jgi:hypothetical protein